jgi:hypothetical protein
MALPKPAPCHAEKPPTPAKRVQQGYVYFFRAGNAVKIGFSTNLVQRSKQLQTACSERAFMAKFLKGTLLTERQVHEKFAEYRLNGEWFDLRGRLAKYLERNFRPIDFPAPVPVIPPPEEDIRL